MFGIFAETFIVATRMTDALNTPRIRPVEKKRSRWTAPARWVQAPKEF